MPACGIECAVALQNPINRGARGYQLDDRRRSVALKRHADRIGTIFTEHATFTQLPSRTQDALLGRCRGAIPGAARLSTGKPRTVNTVTASLLNPVGHGAHTDAKCTGDLPQALPGARSLDHLAATFLD